MLYYCVLFIHLSLLFLFFFFNDTATTEIYTLSLHDALPISFMGPAAPSPERRGTPRSGVPRGGGGALPGGGDNRLRSEEHTSELQSHVNLVCRLLLEKKKKKKKKQKTANTTKILNKIHRSLI